MIFLPTLLKGQSRPKASRGTRRLTWSLTLSASNYEMHKTRTYVRALIFAIFYPPR